MKTCRRSVQEFWMSFQLCSDANSLLTFLMWMFSSSSMSLQTLHNSKLQYTGFLLAKSIAFRSGDGSLADKCCIVILFDEILVSKFCILALFEKIPRSMLSFA